MPSKSGCSPVDICRPDKPPRSAWRTSVVDNEPRDYSLSPDVNEVQGHLKVTQGQAEVSPSHVEGHVVVSEGEVKSSSVVDKTAADSSVHRVPSSEPGALTSGFRRTSPDDGARPNGQCGVDRRSTPNGHCATRNTLPGGMSRGTSDHVISGDTETGGAGVEAKTPGCFACIALCHSKDSRKSSK